MKILMIYLTWSKSQFKFDSINFKKKIIYFGKKTIAIINKYCDIKKL